MKKKTFCIMLEIFIDKISFYVKFLKYTTSNLLILKKKEQKITAFLPRQGCLKHVWAPIIASKMPHLKSPVVTAVFCEFCKK